MLKRLMRSCCILLIVFMICSCATLHEAQQQDQPQLNPEKEYYLVRKDVMQKLLEELVWTKQQLLECLDKLKEKRASCQLDQ